MKVLVLLALFSVCNANILWQEPKTKLDMVKDAFWDYVAKATTTTEESLRQIRESELGQELNTRIAQSAEAVNQYINILKTQTYPVSQDFITKLNAEAEVLKERLVQELTSASATLQPQAEELVASIQKNVDELKKEAATFVESMDIESLKQAVAQKSEDLKQQLTERMSGLQIQMEPYTEEIKEKVKQTMSEFERTMTPLTQDFERQLTQKTQEIQQNLVPLGEQLKANLDASAQDMQDKLMALWESFAKTQ